MTTDDMVYWVTILCIGLVVCMVMDEIKVWLKWR